MVYDDLQWSIMTLCDLWWMMAFKCIIPGSYHHIPTSVVLMPILPFHSYPYLPPTTTPLPPNSNLCMKRRPYLDHLCESSSARSWTCFLNSPSNLITCPKKSLATLRSHQKAPHRLSWNCLPNLHFKVSSKLVPTVWRVEIPWELKGW